MKITHERLLPCGLLLALLAMASALVPSVLADIPPVPAQFDVFHDLAGIVDDAEEKAIRTLQEQLFEQARVPLVVVTVRTMREYDPSHRASRVSRAAGSTRGESVHRGRTTEF